MTPTSRRIILGTMIALHLGGDLLWPWCVPARSECLAYAGVGLMIAQLNLLAVWAAWRRAGLWSVCPGPCSWQR